MQGGRGVREREREAVERTCRVRYLGEEGHLERRKE